MLGMRALRYGLAAIALLLLGFAAWAGWLAFQVNDDLTESVDHANAIRSSVESGDLASVDAEIDALQDSSDSAADRTSGWTWDVLTVLPMFGDDAEGIATTSQVLSDLATDGIEPLLTVSDSLDQLLPQDGAIDLDVVTGLQEPVAQAQEAFAAADEELNTLDPSGYVGRFRMKFDEFRGQVSQADNAMSAARTTADVLPTMLGSEGERNFILAFENNAEIRATGGLPSAMSLIRADDGQLEIARQASSSDFGYTGEPVLPLTETELELWDEHIGTFVQNTNLTADVPRASDLMRAQWENVFPRDEIDGVLWIDTVTLGYVLDATGPVTVDGIEITAANVVDELLHNVYLRLEDPADQDKFFADVASAAFARFTQGLDGSTALVRALHRAADERRVFVHSYDDAEQSELTGTAVAGELVTDPEVAEPQINVTLNDTTGAKMSYFLRYEVDVTATSCSSDTQSFSAKARLESVAPDDAGELPDYVTGAEQFGVDAGSQVVTVQIIGPVGGTVTDVELNARKLDAIEVVQDGRPLSMLYVQLDPGQTVDLSWRMRGGEGQTGDADVAVTPTIEPDDYANSLASAC